MNQDETKSAAPKRELSLFDATCIIVGIVIGAGIFGAPADVAKNAGSPGWMWFAWLFGGLVAMVGSLVYAELAVTYPKDGGEYVYLTRAFGRRMGLLFAWSQLWVVRPGNIGAMAFIFADYAQRLHRLGGEGDVFGPILYASGAIGIATLANVLGVREGKWTQNALTTAKVLGLVSVCAAAIFTAPVSANPTETAANLSTSITSGPIASGSIGLALIMAMFSFGGWNDVSLVAAEVRNPRKNLVRALVIGAVTVLVIYLAANASYVYVLGFEGVANSDAVAADVMQKWLGPWGKWAVSLIICVSCLGAVNGMVLTGSRIYYAMANDHRALTPLGRWNAKWDAPLRALALQACVTLAVVIGFGMRKDGFARMIVFTSPVFWSFFTLAGISLFVLRRRDPDRERPFRVPLYPLTPIIFCVSSFIILLSSLQYAYFNRSHEAAWAIGVMAVGLVVSLLTRSTNVEVS